MFKLFWLLIAASTFSCSLALSEDGAILEKAVETCQNKTETNIENVKSILEGKIPTEKADICLSLCISEHLEKTSGETADQHEALGVDLAQMKERHECTY